MWFELFEAQHAIKAHSRTTVLAQPHRATVDSLHLVSFGYAFHKDSRTDMS